MMPQGSLFGNNNNNINPPAFGMAPGLFGATKMKMGIGKNTISSPRRTRNCSRRFREKHIMMVAVVPFLPAEESTRFRSSRNHMRCVDSSMRKKTVWRI